VTEYPQHVTEAWAEWARQSQGLRTWDLLTSEQRQRFADVIDVAIRSWVATAAAAAGLPEPPPDQWAVIELMGHVTIIGRVTETTLAGAPMLRVDRIDGRVQRVSPQALYRLTDVTEAEAQAAWTAQASFGGSLRGLPSALTQRDAWHGPFDADGEDIDEDDLDDPADDGEEGPS
jgi:protein-disulfide isomerase-like protein with CxxC motif